MKRNVLIAGRPIPGIQISAPQNEVVTTSSGKRINATFADVMTLRETNPANGPVNKYLTVTRENLRFTTLRNTVVPGLDIHEETGQPLSIEELESRREADIAAHQMALLARRTPASVSLEDALADAD